jgi:hypothetical protein
MTMHLAHPAITTTGKRRGKRKFASAEAKHKAEQLQAQWNDNLRKWGATDTSKTRARDMKGTLKATVKYPPGREPVAVQSLDTGWITCARPHDKEYTGTKCKGIGTMHKSNAVPIFSDTEAVEISKMRR